MAERRGAPDPAPDPAPASDPHSGAGPGPGPEDRATRHGAGRVLIAVYAVFALSATGRAVVQLTTQYSLAPLAYWLSALSGAVYVVATIALGLATARSRRVALAAVLVELAGVVGVGTWWDLDPGAFGHVSAFSDRATVWAQYGQGYGYVPLVLPLLGLAWLARTRRRR